jgi:hypothetical protein
MLDARGFLFGVILRQFPTPRTRLLENLTLSQQPGTSKRIRPKGRRALFDIFWVLARRFWSLKEQALIVVDRKRRAIDRNMVSHEIWNRATE